MFIVGYQTKKEDDLIKGYFKLRENLSIAKQTNTREQNIQIIT